MLIKSRVKPNPISARLTHVSLALQSVSTQLDLQHGCIQLVDWTGLDWTGILVFASDVYAESGIGRPRHLEAGTRRVKQVRYVSSGDILRIDVYAREAV